MKLSTRCRYGLRAIIEIARRYNSGPVKRKDISRSQDISMAYLENILIALREKKLIATIRGANGGFALRFPPRSVTVLQIVNALEGSIAPVECLDNPSACGKSCSCPAQKVWKKLYDAQVAVLKGITLQDILDDEDATGALQYTI